MCGIRTIVTFRTIEIFGIKKQNHKTHIAVRQIYCSNKRWYNKKQRPLLPLAFMSVREAELRANKMRLIRFIKTKRFSFFWRQKDIHSA